MRKRANFSESALDAVAGDDDAVARVGAPELEELSREAVLEHAGTGHQHARPEVLEVRDVLLARARKRLCAAQNASRVRQ